MLGHTRCMLKHSFRSRRGATLVCGVDIYRTAGGVIVMVTELSSNRGISVTTCIDELATDLALGLLDVGLIDAPQALRWIEHDEGTAMPKAPWKGATWDEVFLEWDGRRFRSPRWRPWAGDRFRAPQLGESIRPHELAI